MQGKGSRVDGDIQQRQHLLSHSEELTLRPGLWEVPAVFWAERWGQRHSGCWARDI